MSGYETLVMSGKRSVSVGRGAIFVLDIISFPCLRLFVSVDLVRLKFVACNESPIYSNKHPLSSS